MISMKTKSRFVARTSPSAAEPSSALPRRLRALYEQAQRSDHVFGSPLGPFAFEGREHALPRFVYFGPHTSQESVRLGVLAGFGRHDRIAVNAVLAFVESLARESDIGQSLNVSFFPVVNVAGLLGDAEERDLASENWATSRAPEIALLNQDTRRCGYQAFVRVVTTSDDEPSAWVRTVRTPRAHATDLEVFDASDFGAWPVRFARVAAADVHSGPLALADALPFAPFEVELALPADWPQARADRAIAERLKHLIVRYRGFLAYGQHL